jgi:hypothetical protein
VQAEAVPDSRKAAIRAADLARECGGLVVAAGSLYLLRAVREAASVRAS